MSEPIKSKAGTLQPSPAGFRFSLRAMFIGVLICALPCAFWVAIIQPAQEAQLRSQCTINMKQIGLGLHNYLDVYKHFPAAIAFDKAQNPLHSWRLSIVWLSTSTGPNFTNPFRYHEPWNSPHNRTISDRLANGPLWYRCPDAPKSQPLGNANYVMPIGPQAISDGTSYLRPRDIRDGMAQTIAVAEIAESDIYWTEPRDLPLDSLSFRVNDRSGKSISSSHRGGAMALFADGSSRFLSNQTDSAVLKALMTTNGGETLPGEFR